MNLKQIGGDINDIRTQITDDAGNLKPRIFRLEKDKAMINRLGFNNDGMEAVSDRLIKSPPEDFLGINVGPNKDTKDKTLDFAKCFDKLNSLYLQLHEMEKKYALSLDELDRYLELKNEIKSIRLKIDFGISKPKIALLGINPHSGDNGIIGQEDDAILKPVIKEISESVSIPITVLGGAGNTMHLEEAYLKGYANGLAAGSMFVYHGSKKGVLINYVDKRDLNFNR